MYSTNLYCSYVKLALPIREKTLKKLHVVCFIGWKNK